MDPQSVEAAFRFAGFEPTETDVGVATVLLDLLEDDLRRLREADLEAWPEEPVSAFARPPAGGAA